MLSRKEADTHVNEKWIEETKEDFCNFLILINQPEIPATAASKVEGFKLPISASRPRCACPGRNLQLAAMPRRGSRAGVASELRVLASFAGGLMRFLCKMSNFCLTMFGLVQQKQDRERNLPWPGSEPQLWRQPLTTSLLQCHVFL